MSIEKKRFQKQMEIEIRKQNFDQINHSTTRLLSSVFDKRRFENKKRRCISRDSKIVQMKVVDYALEATSGVSFVN